MSAAASHRATTWAEVSDFGRVYQRRRDGRFYVDCKPYGRVYTAHGAEIRDRAQAEAILSAIRVVVAQGTPKRQAVEAWLPTASAPNRIDRWLALWLERLEELHRAGDLSDGYLTEIRRWVGKGEHAYIRQRWALVSIHNVKRSDIEAWSVGLGKRGLAAKTRWNILAAFSAFFGWLVEIEEVARAPRFSWPPVQEHVPRILAPVDQRRILDAIPLEARGIFLACALLGVRPSEGRRADAGDFEPGETPWLAIRRTKNRRAKRLPVPDELAEWVEVHVPREARLAARPLFAMPWRGRGKAKVAARRWSKTGMRRAWEAACKAAKIDGVSLYEGTKHSRATELLRQGVSERVLQTILGHRDPRSTRRYAQLADQAVVVALRGGSKVAPGNGEGGK